MSSRFKILGIGFILFFGLFTIAPIVQAQEVQTNMMKFGRLLRLIESFYVDTTNIEQLTEDAINEMLTKLDPHSVYISKDEVEKMNEPLQGSFEGIGISFNIFKDTLLVVTTIPGGPSEKVGLMPGDRIIYIDEKPVAGIGMKNSDVTDMLRGNKGTQVEVQILRNKNKNLLDFTIVRDKIPINSLDASYMLNDETGYIKLNRFSATTTEEFLTAITDLKTNYTLNNLVLDLRGNGGGYLNTAIELADQFLKTNQLVVYTEGNHDQRKEYIASPLGVFEEGKLIVLINENSASASEIVSGAIQDWDRGIIIGRRSFGKGLVQQPFMLNDGSMVRLTTAHYYTPSGRCIQKPYENGVEEYRNDYITRLENGELFEKDSIEFDENQIYETLKNKRIVYGGGGVMPDIFVPMDTSANYMFYNQLVRKNILYTEALNYLDSNREKLTRKYIDFESFNDKFEIEEEVIETLKTKAEKDEVEMNMESIEFSLPFIKRQFKALLARDLYSMSQYYQIMNQDEEIIHEALSVLRNSSEYEKLLVEK